MRSRCDCVLFGGFMKRENVAYYLGIDGGGTKTAFMLCDTKGAVVNQCILPGCNPIDIGMEQAKTVLKSGIERVCEGVDYAQISLYAGVAGGITGNNQQELHAFFETFGFAAVRNNSDAMNAVAAGLGEKNGVAVIMGTGCVAFTKINNKYIRTGGFGYLIDAGGDGYSIGRDALRYALYAEQREEGETVLLKLLQKKANGRITEQLSDIYAGGKAYIASFCPVVFEAMREGDITALSIVKNNVYCLSQIITEAAEKMQKKGQVPVALIGSVASQPEIILMLEKIFAEKNSSVSYKFSVSDCEPIVGAVRLAMEEI